MSSPYTSFYHLHIPRTGGRFILNNVINFLTPYMREDGINVINPVPIENPTAHACWHPDIDENTYIMSTLRDPSTHISSLFFQLIVADKSKPQIYPNPPSYDPSLFDKRILIGSLYYGQDGVIPHMMNNFQAKNFLYTRPFIHGPIDPSIDAEAGILTVLERAKRVNFLMRMEDIPKDPMVIADKIIKDLGLSVSLEQVKKDYETRLPYLNRLNELIVVPEVKKFSEDFDEEAKRHIWPKIRTDYHVYSTDELFYKFN